MKKTIIILLVLISMATACSRKPASDPAFLSMYMGSVEVTTPDGKKAPAQSNQKLYKGDIITTGSESMAVIMMQENRIEIKEDSTLEMLAIQDPAENKPISNSMHMERGSVAVKALLKKDRGDQLDVRTRTMVAAVRGTEFSIEERKGIARVECASGKISIADPKGERAPLELKEGSFMAIDTVTGKVSTGSIKEEKKVFQQPIRKETRAVENFSEKPSAVMPTVR